MFRRKEENATDFTDVSANSNGAAHAHESAPVAAAAVSAPVASAASPVYTPATYAPAAPRAAAVEAPRAEAPRAVASAAYRPTPVAEFNRTATAARPASEPARTSAPAATSFSALSDKASHTAVKPVRRVLTVGNDILLKGEIAACDRISIEGRVDAKVTDVHTVEIAECGSFKGTAEVEDAEISGVFEGDLIVRNRLVIYSTGEVRGNITYGEIEIERGGKLTGQIKTIAAAASASKVKTLEPEVKAARALKESAAA